VIIIAPHRGQRQGLPRGASAGQIAFCSLPPFRQWVGEPVTGQTAFMLEAAVIGLLLFFPLLGIFVRHWVVVLLPLVGWPLFYLGLNKGWWLYGAGDGWQIVRDGFTVIGVVSTAFAVMLARRIKPRSKKWHVGHQRDYPASG
jgi:hypothetical protein